MFSSFEQADVGVAADSDIEVSVGGRFLQKPDMAGMEPIEGAGNEDPLVFFLGGDRQRLPPQNRDGREIEDVIVHSAGPAESFFPGRGVGLGDGPDVCSEADRLRQRIWGIRSFYGKDPVDEAEGLEKIGAFRKGEAEIPSFHSPDDRIRREGDVHLSELRGRLEKPDVGRAEVVERSCDDDLFGSSGASLRSFRQLVLTLIVNVPGTSFSEATMR